MAAFDWVEALPEHVDYLAENAREADIAELWATNHVTPKEALLHGLNISRCWTGRLYGEPVCMFGFTPVEWGENVAAVWMVGTKKIDEKPLTFLKGSRSAVDFMLSQKPVLVNYVDDRHKKAIRWLRNLGAEIFEPVEYGIDKLPFHFFQIVRA